MSEGEGEASSRGEAEDRYRQQTQHESVKDWRISVRYVVGEIAKSFEC